MREPRRSRLWSAWALAVLTVACASHTAPDRARVAGALTEHTGVDAAGLPPPGSAWTAPPGVSLDDGLTIEEAVGAALWNNAAFQATLASLGLARADLVEAGLLRNPVFSLLFPWGPKQLEFTLTWPIDALWQRPRRVEQARLNAEAVAQDLIAGGLRFVGEVRLAFLEVIASERRLALAAEQGASAAEAARLAEGRLRAGDISDLDARLAQTDALRLEAARLTRQAARDAALVRLRSLIGLSPDASPMRLIDPGLLSVDGCGIGPDLVRAALAARPDVRVAEVHLEAAAARAGLERASILAFTASLDANASGTEGFEAGPGVVVELPVLSQNQGRRARAAAELEQASRRYLAVRASVAAEIATAELEFAEARDAARLFGDDLPESLATARRQSEGLFSAGEISLLTLLDTRRRLVDVEAARVEAVLRVSRAIVRLEQAVGRTCAPR